MFTIYRKVIISPDGGRDVHDTYYRSWENAKAQLDTDAETHKERGYWKPTRNVDRMNTRKGFYEYEKEFASKVDGKLIMRLALIDGYFSDDD